MRKVLLILGIVIIYAIVVFVNLPLEKFCMQDVVCFQQTLTIIALTSFITLILFVLIGLLLIMIAPPIVEMVMTMKGFIEVLLEKQDKEG